MFPSKFLKRNWPLIILFLVLAIITIFNIKIYWALVDDGWEVIFAKNLFIKLTTLNIAGFFSSLSEGDGRIRIVFWLYRIILWIVGGTNPQIYHLANMLVIGATMLFIFLIIKKISKSNLLSFLGAIFYLLVPTNTENIIRIGTAEPLLVLLLSIFFYLVLEKKKILLPCVVLFLAILSKETVVFAILPVLFAYYFLSNKNKQSFILWLCVSISAVLMVLVSLLQRHGYSTNYVFDLPMFTNNFLIYAKDITKNTLLILPISFITFYYSLFSKLFKSKKIKLSETDKLEIIFSLGFVSFLAVQLPWKFAVSRYLMPEVFFAIIFLSLEIKRIYINLFKSDFFKKKRWFLPTLATITFIFFLSWGYRLVVTEKSVISNYPVFEKMSKLPKNTTILLTITAGGEYEEEIRTQLHEFWGRGDLDVGVLNLNQLPKNNYIVISSDSWTEKYEESELKAVAKNKEEYKSEETQLMFVTPDELLRCGAKAIVPILISRKQTETCNLYFYNKVQNNWYFYKK